MERESGPKTFKVTLLIDGVETEVMFTEAASHTEAGP